MATEPRNGTMNLTTLVTGIPAVERLDALGSSGAMAVEVRDIRHDSREVVPGDLFVAIRGDSFDGHRFLTTAVQRGAVALVGTDAAALKAAAQQGGVAALQVENAPEALWQLCRARYLAAIEPLRLVGITGTNGKTTVSFLVEAICTAAGIRTGRLGTIGQALTTAEAPGTWRTLRQLVAEGARAAVMEVSSHALEQRRADGLPFAATAFTNLTQDHLDFHGDLKAYWRAKRRLFFDVAPDAPVVVNLDDPTGAGLAAELGARAVATSAEGAVAAAVRPRGTARIDLHGIRCALDTPAGAVQVRSKLLGMHNLANICVAVGLGTQLGLGPDAMSEGLAALGTVPGRLERVSAADGPTDVFVDYAHTPDALGRVLAELRRITDGRLVVVFGCGGDRDADKRPMMGAAAARNADLVVVTSDNPRSEAPQRIIDDIVPGLEAGDARVEIEPDRRIAIARALELARPGDTVLIAGKGHETWQIVGDVRRPFDDRKVARELIAGSPARSPAGGQARSKD